MGVNHPLAGALSVVLPKPDDAGLLRACVVEGRPGRDACEAWINAHEDLTPELKREFVKSVLPLLYRAVREHSVDVRSSFLTILRTAAVREQLRTRTYSRICRRVLATLVRSKVPFVLLRGAALAETVYPDPALRHSHNIELLVESRAVTDAAALLGPIGFTRTPKAGVGRVSMVHESGLPLTLRADLFDIPFYNSVLPRICSRTTTVDILDKRVSVLAPDDALLHVCAEAACPAGIESYRWIDAWFIAERRPDLDWDRMFATSQAVHLSLPIAIVLSCLAEDLNCRIPVDVLQRFSGAAEQSPPFASDLALFGARRSPEGALLNLIRNTDNWRGRLRIFRWMLSRDLRSQPLLPLYYLRSRVRYISRRFRSAAFSSNL